MASSWDSDNLTSALRPINGSLPTTTESKTPESESRVDVAVHCLAVHLSMEGPIRMWHSEWRWLRRWTAVNRDLRRMSRNL